MVPPCSDRMARVPPYSRIMVLLPVRGCHPLWRAFPDASGTKHHDHWPGPRSLATTSGVSVDVLSSGYLDVSVPRVRLARLWIHRAIPPKRWVAPFGNLRIKERSPLPGAYRSVPRPSSPLDAKASTRCPSFARPAPATSRPGRQAYPCLRMPRPDPDAAFTRMIVDAAAQPAAGIEPTTTSRC